MQKFSTQKFESYAFIGEKFIEIHVDQFSFFFLEEFVRFFRH